MTKSIIEKQSIVYEFQTDGTPLPFQGKEFSEIFDSVERWERGPVPPAPMPDIVLETPDRNDLRISPCMRISSHDGRFAVADAMPTDELVEYIRTNMLALENGRIHFKAVIRKDGSVLLTAVYETILGSRWLTVLSPEDRMSGEIFKMTNKEPRA